MRGDEKGTRMLILQFVETEMWSRKMQRKFQNMKTSYRSRAHVECVSKSDASNNRGDWNHLKITPTIPEQRIVKARI